MSELGQQVTFTRIVKKEKNGRNTKPQTIDLKNIQTGIVVGLRYVYDARMESNAIFPYLTNRQTVLLVATSLHRTYKVFPCDAVSANSAAPMQT